MVTTQAMLGPILLINIRSFSRIRIRAGVSPQLARHHYLVKLHLDFCLSEFTGSSAIAGHEQYIALMREKRPHGCLLKFKLAIYGDQTV